MSAPVFFKHTYITNPSDTPTDTIVLALDNVTTALQVKMPTPIDESSLQDIQSLQTIIGQAKAMRGADNTKAIQTETQPTDFPPR